MKLTTSLIRSKATGPLPSLEFLDLSKLGIVSIEKLNSCPKLRTLKLRGNNISEISNLECCPQLWNLDAGNNKIVCLEGLSRFLAIGTLILSNNNLTWKDLVKIRHLHVLNISLHGNPHLEKDPYYRIHVIDCLPNVWMLDGRVVTSAERLQVKHFFQDSALTDHPVRHKLGRDWFVPSAMKKIQVNGIFGEKARHLLTKFPINAVHNIDIDKKRLKYLAFNLQEDLAIEDKHTRRELQVLKFRKTFLEDLLECRPTDRERCNMLLLLLVASLEFVMPTHLVKETLETAKLFRLGKVYTMDLFLLPKDVRCQVVSLLLSAVKVDKDLQEDGGLYDRLYLCLFYTVAELTRLSQSDGQGESSVLAKMQKIYRDYKCLLASEIVQLMCIVPAFFEYMDKDVGVMNLVTTGTGDRSVIDKIGQLTHNCRLDGKDVRVLYEDIAELLLQKVQDQTLNLTNKSHRDDIADNIQGTLPGGQKVRRTLEVADYHTKGVTSPDMDPPVLQVHATRTRPEMFPHLGDIVLIGPQTVGKIISLPQPFLALVAIDAVPVSNGAMVHKLKDQDDHYVYVNMKQLEWDTGHRFWKPLGTVGDRYTIQSTEDMKKDLERRALLVDKTSRPNSPDSFMHEPPAREPTPLFYSNQSRADTPSDIVKAKLSVHDSVFVQINGESVSPSQQRVNNRSNPELQSDEEPELQSLGAGSSRSKSPAMSTRGGNSESTSDLPPPAHLDIQMPSVKDWESNPSTARETGRKLTGRLRKGMTYSAKTRPVSGKASPPFRAIRPFSAVDAYRYFVTTQPINRPESGYNTAFQLARTEAWKKQAASVAMSASQATPPPQRPTSPAAHDISESGQSHLHVHPANYWLAGGRDLYWESQQKRPKSGHTPGWKEGLPRNMKTRPKSAVASRTLRRAKTPNVITPSSLAYEAMLAGYANQELPALPHLADYRPLSHHLGLPRRLGSPPPGVDDYYAKPTQDTVYR